MSTEGHEDHFAHKVSKQTLTMLMAYRELGILSRTFMLKEHAKMLEGIRSKKGSYETYSEHDLQFVESCIYVELIERLCYLIEDLCVLSYALWDDLPNFPKRVISHPSPERLLKELVNNSHWFNLLRYPNPDNLDLSAGDKEFVKHHYDNNIRVLKKFVQKLTEFHELYWLFHTKRKHANPLIYGLGKENINGEPTSIMPYAYNAKQPDKLKAIPLRYSMYEKQKKLLDTLVVLMNDLLFRAILFIERDGMHIMEYTTFYKIKTEDKEKLQKLIQLHDANIVRTNIQVTLKLAVDIKYLRPFFDFYENFDLGAFDVSPENSSTAI